MANFNISEFVEGMPHLKGRLVEGAPLARLSWFRTGGPADLLFEPAGEADLITFLRHLPASVPLTVIGVGSNLLVRDGGVEGVVIRLGRSFANIEARGNIVKAGAGAMDVHVARFCADKGLSGLEFLVGVPGTIGGAVKMNAGAYGREIADVFVHTHAVDRLGHIHELGPDDLKFAYRKSAVTDDYIILGAAFKTSPDDAEIIKVRMNEITTNRQDSQPIGTRTGGSTFKNPDGMKAWELIDQAGCRGMRVGDAQISEKHCNFLINHGSASAADIETLGEAARDAVREKTGVTLEWEVRIIGRVAADVNAAAQPTKNMQKNDNQANNERASA
ncbi:UDP-N-acetylmuramate dehydrogenase [Kordiimonas sp. SCSIO 12610]|uniref:UDP-N-acetylmuramate dehydrogenase n=1 Tax=Kordiimonas sp. SCSIO 12610 TaxID=2829597 RepID=UPI00210A301D|nr:UDP-N-acetylmuramate dehydrogenase [Kordiimonas sp. SCSIO 12610]UTW56412.1 UDP-N-acetylmuramate dehydrogenase [Kordiimonas sp. SCSIO 12610]